jgi:hypothetical protein
MAHTVLLSPGARSTAGVLLLSIVAIEYGGTYMLRIVRGRVPMTEFQRNFARAGHAHAGVLVILALVCQVLADGAGVHGLPSFGAHTAIPAAAILVSAGSSCPPQAASAPGPIVSSCCSMRGWPPWRSARWRSESGSWARSANLGEWDPALF